MNEILFVLGSLLTAGVAVLAVARGYEAAVSLLTLQCVLANLLVYKQISLFSLSVTATDFLIVGASVTTALITNRFGAAAARRASVLALCGLLFYQLLIWIHHGFIAIPGDWAALHYSTLFDQSPRLVFGSITAFIIGQRLDVALFSRITNLVPHAPLWLRMLGSVVPSQCVDTICFALIALSGVVENLGHIMLFSVIVKVVSYIATTPALALTKLSKRYAPSL